MTLRIVAGDSDSANRASSARDPTGSPVST